MQQLLEILYRGMDAFLLVFVRMTGLFVISPIFGRRNVPAYLKIGFSFFLALILVNVIALPELDYYNNIYQFALLIFKEFVVGTAIGFVTYLAFSAIYVAGQLIDMQIGFGMVNILDPLSNIQIPVTANFYFILSMLAFLAVRGHHAVIKALFASYKMVPLGGALFNDNLTEDVMRIFGNMFIIGFKIAAPVTAAILIADVAMGVMSKTIPQLNVFVVGMPAKIFLGIAALMITIPMFILLLGKVFDWMNYEVFKFLRDMGAG